MRALGKSERRDRLRPGGRGQSGRSDSTPVGRRSRRARGFSALSWAPASRASALKGSPPTGESSRGRRAGVASRGGSSSRRLAYRRTAGRSIPARRLGAEPSTKGALDARRAESPAAAVTREAEEPRSEHFAGEVAGLAESGSSQLVELSHGDTFDLRIAPVTKRLGDDRVRMLAYNGSIPGPTLKVPQGSERGGQRHQRGRHGGDRPLARPSPRQPLRRDSPDPGSHPGGRQLLLSGRVPGPGRLLVPPPHPRGLRQGDGPLRQRPGGPGGPRPLGSGESRGAADPR